MKMTMRRDLGAETAVLTVSLYLYHADYKISVEQSFVEWVEVVFVSY